MRNSAKNPIVKDFKNKDGETIAAIRKTETGFMACLNRSMIQGNTPVRKNFSTKTEAVAYALEKAREVFGEDQISLRA